MNMMTNEQIAKIEEMRRDIEKWEGHILLTSEEYCVHLLAEIDRLQAKLEKTRAALTAALEWIDAVPGETPLPAMPGFDRDEVEGVLSDD